MGGLGRLPDPAVPGYVAEEKADQEKDDLSRRLDRIGEMSAQALARQDKTG
jgi:hypothetical protein